MRPVETSRPSRNIIHTPANSHQRPRLNKPLEIDCVTKQHISCVSLSACGRTDLVVTKVVVQRELQLSELLFLFWLLLLLFSYHPFLRNVIIVVIIILMFLFGMNREGEKQ